MLLIVIRSASLVASNEAGCLLHHKHTQKMFIQYGLLFTLYVQFVCSPEMFQGAVHSFKRFLYWYSDMYKKIENEFFSYSVIVVSSSEGVLGGYSYTFTGVILFAVSSEVQFVRNWSSHTFYRRHPCSKDEIKRNFSFWIQIKMNLYVCFLRVNFMIQN